VIICGPARGKTPGRRDANKGVKQRGDASPLAIRATPEEEGNSSARPSGPGRQAHLDGPIAAALMQRADELLVSPPDIKPIDVLAAKLPA
jgi:hypothetical protein